MVFITKGFAMIVCVSVFVCMGNVQLNQCGPHNQEVYNDCECVCLCLCNVQLNQCGPHNQGFCHGFVCVSVSECVMCMNNVQLN